MKKAHLTTTIWEEEGAYVSKCPELEVASFGYTPEEALGNLKEACGAIPRERRRAGPRPPCRKRIK